MWMTGQKLNLKVSFIETKLNSVNSNRKRLTTEQTKSVYLNKLQGEWTRNTDD